MLDQFVQRSAEPWFIKDRRADSTDDPTAVCNAFAQVLDDLVHRLVFD
jgi:hypothetical protein